MYSKPLAAGFLLRNTYRGIWKGMLTRKCLIINFLVICKVDGMVESGEGRGVGCASTFDYVSAQRRGKEVREKG